MKRVAKVPLKIIISYIRFFSKLMSDPKEAHEQEDEIVFIGGKKVDRGEIRRIEEEEKLRKNLAISPEKEIKSTQKLEAENVGGKEQLPIAGKGGRSGLQIEETEDLESTRFETNATTSELISVFNNSSSQETSSTSFITKTLKQPTTWEPLKESKPDLSLQEESNPLIELEAKPDSIATIPEVEEAISSKVEMPREEAEMLLSELIGYKAYIEELISLNLAEDDEKESIKEIEALISKVQDSLSKVSKSPEEHLKEFGNEKLVSSKTLDFDDVTTETNKDDSRITSFTLITENTASESWALGKISQIEERLENVEKQVGIPAESDMILTKEMKTLEELLDILSRDGERNLNIRFDILAMNVSKSAQDKREILKIETKDMLDNQLKEISVDPKFLEKETSIIIATASSYLTRIEPIADVMTASNNLSSKLHDSKLESKQKGEVLDSLMASIMKNKETIESNLSSFQERLKNLNC